MKNKITIVVFSDHINSEYVLDWSWDAKFNNVTINPNMEYGSKLAAVRAVRKWLRQLQACKNVEVIIEDD